jgi:ribosomal protein S18 acetylase RimI-like enzyme
MSEMEKYFKDNGCEYVLVDVFGYNDNAIKFYDKYINYLESIDNFEMVILVRNKLIKARENLHLSSNQNS